MSGVGTDRSKRYEPDWEPDPWDDVGYVPRVDPLPTTNRTVKWIVWVAMLVSIVAILAAGYAGWWYLGKAYPDSEPGDPIAFTVTDRDDFDSVAERLHAEGLIDDPDVFEWYVERQGGLELTPGFYEIPTGEHMGDVLAQLNTSPADTFRRITFPEGFTLQQMAERLAEEDPRLDADEFVDAATSGDVESPFLPPGGTTLEGLLFPDTYTVSNSDNEAQVVERMVSLMERVASQEDLEERATELGVTPYQVFVIASMIEREARVPEDRPKIARVIYNRLAIGMNLQIDASVYYGAPEGFDGPFSELRQIPGPYNTYLNAGLPATPIANPGRASINAALNPAPKPPPSDPACDDLTGVDPGRDKTQCDLFFYVLADSNGAHAFSWKVEDHEYRTQQAAAEGLL